MKSTIKTPIKPPTEAVSDSGEHPAYIFLQVKKGAAHAELCHKIPDVVAVGELAYGQLFEKRLRTSLSESSVPTEKITGSGCMESFFALITLNRDYALAAIKVIRQILGDANLESTSSIHWLLDPDEPFRIAHHGERLGPPVTITKDSAADAVEAAGKATLATLAKITPKRMTEIYRILSSSPPPDNAS